MQKKPVRCGGRELRELAVLRANRAQGRKGLVGCVGHREMVGWGREVLLGTGGREMGKVTRVKRDYLCSLSLRSDSLELDLITRELN